MIVFAGIVPCSPLLVSSVNPERVGRAEKTRAALQEMAEELYARRPDTLVLFCEHTQSPSDAFALNIADPYHTNLTAFGDLGYHGTYASNFLLADRMQRALRKLGEPVTLITEQTLPYTATVPLLFLTEHLPAIRLLTIAPCARSAKEHFDFGAALRDLLVSSDSRIAIIACGDGAHTRTPDAPQGFHPDGERSDQQLSTCIVQKNTAGLLHINPETLKNAHNGNYRQIVMLFGALDATPVEPYILAEEAPFGIGEITAEMVLQ